MALSNWDTLAFDLYGPSTGRVTNHQNLTIEIYKNWLYLRAGREDPQAEDPQIICLTEGQLTWGAWTVTARRGPQDGVFVVATSYRFLRADEIKGDPDQVDRYADPALLVGCGVYGFENELETHADRIRAQGYDPEDPDVAFVTGSQGGRAFVDVVEDGVGIRLLDGLKEPGWVGVTQRSVDFLKAMVAEQTKASKHWDPTKVWPGNALVSIDWNAALRANQGDMFFAEAFDTDLPATPPGKAADPLLIQALESDDEDGSAEG